MSYLYQAELNEVACPVDEPTFQHLLQSTASEFPLLIDDMTMTERAKLAHFCYNKRHYQDLAYRLAATCDLKALHQVFGAGAPVVFRQSRNHGSTMEEMDRWQVQKRRATISLAGIAKH